MSTVKIRSLTTTATTTASDDFLVIDGTTNSTRKLSAATPAFLTSVTVPTVATAAGVNLNLATGTAASDKVLIPGTLEATAADGLAASIGTLGGASVKKALWVGGIINVAGHTTFEGVTSTGATGTGNLVYDTSPSLTTPALGTPSALVGTNITGTAAGLTAGNVTTNANLTGDVTSVGNATSIAAGVIVNADINASAAIVDTKLDTIATALKVSNSATTAASANTASAIVARDASGNFSAGTVSAALTGNASTATALATGRTIAITGDLAYTSPSFDGSGNVTAAGTLASVASAGTSGGSTAIPVVTINAKGLTTSITTAAVIAPAGTLTGSTLASGVTASSLTSLGTIASLAVTAGTISTTPSASTDIANKLYVDTVAQGLDAKASCIAATTANITLSGTQTIDGISVIAADRVLVKDQTLSQNNGIYLCASGAWTRTTDADTWDELTSAFVFIETGTVNADTGWVCTANAGGTLGTTALPWSQFSGAGSYTASTGLTLTGTVFSLTAPVTVALGGTNATSAGIASFNNITGYTASGATGTTSTNLVFSTSPTITSPTITGGALNGTLGATTPSSVAATTGTFSSTLGATGLITASANGQGISCASADANGSYLGFRKSGTTYIGAIGAATQSGGVGTVNDVAVDVGGANHVYITTAQTIRGDFTAAGLAITGTLSATGTVSIPYSSDATPALCFNNAANTGIGSFAGDSLRFTVGGTRRFLMGSDSTLYGEDNAASIRLASSGAITLTGNTAVTGTLSATGNVTIASASNQKVSVQITDSGNDRNAELELLSSGNGGSEAKITFGDTDTTPGTPSPLCFYGYHSGVATKRMTIDSSGNVGINETSPTQGKLVINNPNGSTDSGVTGNSLYLKAATVNANLIRLSGAIATDLIIGRFGNADSFSVGTTGGATFATFNSTGLGIGTTSPASPLHVYSGASGVSPVAGSVSTIESNSNTYLSILGPAANARGIFLGSPTSQTTAGIVYNYDVANGLSLRAAGATIGTFSSTGLAVTGQVTTTDKVGIGSGGSTDGELYIGFNGSALYGINVTDSNNASSASFLSFRKANNSGIGGVSRVGATDAVVYNTTSDARLKENLRDFTDSGRLIDALKPRVFDWKDSDGNGKDAIGFIAQEEHAADPVFAHIGAVSVGDDDPTTITKQWQRSDAALIPILVAELQSLRKRLAALEAK